MARKTKIPRTISVTIKDVPTEYRDLFNDVCAALHHPKRTKAEIFSELVRLGAAKAYGEDHVNYLLERHRLYRERTNAGLQIGLE